MIEIYASDSETSGLEMSTLPRRQWCRGDSGADSADQLVAALPHGRLAMVPGDHSTAGAAPELCAAIVDFLDHR